MAKTIIVVATNSLTNTQYEAYTNHIQKWYNLGRMKKYRNLQFILMNPARMSIDRMRNLAAKTALEVGAKYLLFLDDDVLIQPDGLGRLLDAKADIAAGKVVIRGYPFDWMIFKKKGKGLFPCPSLPETGVEPCDAVGFSFCLIKVDLLKKIPTTHQPYFVTGVNNTEDIYFCIRARQADPKCTIVCACDALCGHILWPEVMDANNRLEYKRYFERMNPSLVKAKKQEAIDKIRNKRGDRGGSYLADVKEITKNA